MCTPHSGRAHWPLTTCGGGREGGHSKHTTTGNLGINMLGAKGGTTLSTRSHTG